MDLPRRHHYIPQFMLKGFASRQGSKENHVWMFRQGLEAKETNTKNFAQERDFHGNPATSQLEFQMRDQEALFSKLVERLRSGTLANSDLPTISPFIVHLLTRTKNLRSGLTAAAAEVFDQFGVALPRMNRRTIKHQMQKAMRKELRESGIRDKVKQLPISQQKIAKKLMKKSLRENDFRSPMSEMFGQLRQGLDVEQVATNAHIKALSNVEGRQTRVGQISHLTWELLVRDEHTWILGDVVITGIFSGSREIRSLANVVGPIELVIAPLSDAVCLIGKSSPDVIVPDVENINIAASELSREFFMASQNTARELGYYSYLGKRAELLTEAEMNDVIGSLAK